MKFKNYMDLTEKQKVFLWENDLIIKIPYDMANNKLKNEYSETIEFIYDYEPKTKEIVEQMIADNFLY